MDDGWWELSFSLLEGEVIDKQRKETRIVYVVRIRVGDISINSCFAYYR